MTVTTKWFRAYELPSQGHLHEAAFLIQCSQPASSPTLAIVLEDGVSVCCMLTCAWLDDLCKSKVCELGVPILADEQILWLQITASDQS